MLKRHEFSLHIISWEIPRGVANRDADAYPIGLGDSGIFTYCIGIHDSLVKDASSQSVV